MSSSFKKFIIFLHINISSYISSYIINLVFFCYNFINNLAALSHENMSLSGKMNFKFHLSIYSKMLTTFNSKDISEFEKGFFL